VSAASPATGGSDRLHRPAGSTATDDFALAIDPESAGWGFSGLRVLELAPGGSATFDTGEDELLVLPLAGSCAVECDGQRFTLAGRVDVFSGVTDFAYAPREATVRVSSEHGGRFALPAARARRRLPARYGPADGVPVEMRGAGSCSRQVNNFCTPDVFEADQLIACEVLTPGGNWSSYPPHKHDEARPGESELEEIYYFEVAPGPQGAGLGYQRVYGTPERPIDVLAEVRSGDVVLIPHGWHGPSMAAPGYDLYYLNVMAGPGQERAWLICDDPAHGWVRSTWADQQVDPRLPFPIPETPPTAPPSADALAGGPS
jgi:5-deoxy-glucuronate isomerase